MNLYKPNYSSEVMQLDIHNLEYPVGILDDNYNCNHKVGWYTLHMHTWKCTREVHMHIYIKINVAVCPCSLTTKFVLVRFIIWFIYPTIVQLNLEIKCSQKYGTTLMNATDECCVYLAKWQECMSIVWRAMFRLPSALFDLYTILYKSELNIAMIIP